jgi:hypothetical protein
MPVKATGSALFGGLADSEQLAGKQEIIQLSETPTRTLALPVRPESVAFLSDRSCLVAKVYRSMPGMSWAVW